MRDQYPILLLLFPFLCAFAVSLAGLKRPGLCYPICVGATALSFLSTLGLLGEVIAADGHVVRYQLGGWQPPIGIEYVIDPLNAVVLMLIAFVGLITAVYSQKTVLAESPKKAPYFYALFLMLQVGLYGMTITGDAFNLYVFLEISSLTSYALIAMGSGRAALSCFNYIIMGTIGASFILLGVGYLYIKTGSLNMADISRILREGDLYGSQTVEIGFVLILIGVWIKMAFFPLHRWLPNAYTFAPTATSCLIAPLMTKVSVYVMIRFMYTVFTPDFVFQSMVQGKVVVWLSVVAIVVGSFFALAKKKLKKMLAYLILAEVGYMVGGAWLANERGLTGAVFHLISDGLMTLCLFLFAGIVFYKFGNYNLNALNGLFRKMPWTMGAFVVAAFSMIGIPPTCGFFSKWYLITGAIEAGRWEFVAALLFSSLVNAILFFKIIEKAYFGKTIEEKNDHGGHGPETMTEAPLTMLVPLLTTAVMVVLLGVFSPRVIEFISRFVAGTG